MLESFSNLLDTTKNEYKTMTLTLFIWIRYRLYNVKPNGNRLNDMNIKVGT